MKEDMKRKLWAVGLAFLSFFLGMPVAAAMGISSLMRDYELWVANNAMFGNGTVTPEMELAERLQDLAVGLLGLESPLMVFVIVVAALVLALTGFRYVHSKRQMDFYHSIPVRREVIFAVKYLDNFLIIASMYLLNMFLAFGIMAANGINLSLLFDAGFVTFFVHMAGFLLCYGLMTIAVMLTGNFFVSILGGMVLYAYVPAVLALLEGLIYLFFPTANMRMSKIGTYMLHGSPLPYYISLVGDGGSLEVEQYGSIMGRVGLAFLVGLVMAGAAMLLYKLRPSESAGKAMAFKVSRAPIKILLVVPITICMSVLFWNIYYSIPWAVFGFLFGLFISHGIIEVIYHFEFRKLFANPIHMGICAVLSLAVIGVFRYDLIGYDSFMPKEGDFVSASVSAGSLQSWNEYGLPVKDSEDGKYRWQYMNGSDYVAGNMQITDYALIRELAEAGIAEAKTEREVRFIGDDRERKDGYWTSMEVGYQLDNKKKVFRNYTVNVTELRELFDRMYVNEEYKKGTCPVLTYEADNVKGIYECQGYQITAVKADQELAAKILEAYKREYTALTLEERSKAVPVTSLRFLTTAEENYLHMITVNRSPNFTGTFNVEDMNSVNFFPVYPSFTETIALLGEAGSAASEKVPVEDVQRIEIRSSYFERNADSFYGKDQAVAETQANGERVITIVNDGSEEAEEKIGEILNAADLCDLSDLNGLQPREHGFGIQVFRKSVNEGKDPAMEEANQYIFRAGEVPQFIADAVNYDQIEDKRIEYGLNGVN